MVMCAGLGTRLSPLTQLVAKPMVPVLGIPTLQFTFDLLKTHGIEDVTVNVHAHAQAFQQAMRFLNPPKDLHISDESQKLMGSAGGLKAASNFLEPGPFFLLNGDQIAHVNLRDLGLTHQYLRGRYGVKMTLAILSNGDGVNSYREVFVDQKKRMVRGLGSKNPRGSFFCGVAVLESELLNNITLDKPSDFGPLILEPAIRQGRVGTYWIDVFPELNDPQWYDIGSIPAWSAAHWSLMERLQKNELPELWKKRILKHNKQLAPNIWVSNWSALTSAPENWSGPIYFSPEKNSEDFPSEAGPRSLIYGLPGGMSLPSSVFFRGLTEPLQDVVPISSG